MNDQPLADMDLTEEEQKELTNEAPTNEAETNETKTNEVETEEVKEEENSAKEEFKARWADKSPDEMQEALWNQNKARREARKNEKDSKADLSNLLDKLQKSKEERKAKLEVDKKNIEHNFKVDPIKAMKNAQIAQAEQQINQGNIQDRQKEINWHTQRLYEDRPDFPQHAKNIVEWGLKKGYSQEELNKRFDYRDLTIMYDNYMAEKNPDNEPAIVSDFDRAKSNNAPTSLSTVRGARSGKNRSLKQRATEALEMSDEDFNDMSGKELDNILKSLDTA